MEWISTRDKLPPEHLSVLTCNIVSNKEAVDFVKDAIERNNIKNPKIIEQWYYPVMQAFYSDGAWWIPDVNEEGLTNIGVSHWMEIPKSIDNEN